jgi:hypothetical protein
MKELLIFAVFISVLLSSVGAETVKYIDMLTKEELGEDELTGHRYTMEKYDEDGNKISVASFDERGEPDAFNLVHSRVFTYDERGNKTSESYYGVGGEPVNKGFFDRFHRREFTYDDLDRVTSISYFGTEGEAVPYFVNGDYQFFIKYVPTEREKGVHRFEYTYFNRKRKESISYFDVDGSPMVCVLGVHRVVYGYDDLGRKESEAFFGVDGEPVLSKWGVHMYKYSKTEDKIVTESCFGVSGEPIIGPRGFHRVETKWAKDRGEIWRRFFGTENEPIAIPFGD